MLMLGSAVSAEVKIKTLADGTRVVYNEAPASSSRRARVGGMIAPRPYVAGLIARHARRTGLDPRLVQAVMQVESGFRVNARSSKGAMGLMQLMPETAVDLRVSDAYDPDQNVRGGTTYLRRMLDRFDGDLQLALAAYNAGPTAVDRHGGVPPYKETRQYVRKVLGLLHGRAPTIRPASAPQSGTGNARAAQRRTTPIYVVRDDGGQLVFTTTAPASRPN